MYSNIIIISVLVIIPLIVIYSFIGSVVINYIWNNPWTWIVILKFCGVVFCIMCVFYFIGRRTHKQILKELNITKYESTFSIRFFFCRKR